MEPSQKRWLFWVFRKSALFLKFFRTPRILVQSFRFYDKIILSSIWEDAVDYLQKLQYHFKPKKGWINDPNGLVYFDGYYHAFYQHPPDYEVPWKQPMHWGHARTKDFLTWDACPFPARLRCRRTAKSALIP